MPSGILELIASISEKIGEVNTAYLYKPPGRLSKKTMIRTIHSSPEIEGNSLSLDQVTAILDNEKIIAPQKEILEVKNAIKTYDNISQFNPASLTSFCKAHAIFMNGLVKDPGKVRTKSVGIIKGATVTHIAPPGNIVKSLLKDLFDYLKKDQDLLLI